MSISTLRPLVSWLVLFLGGTAVPVVAFEPEVVEWLPENPDRAALEASWADSIHTLGGQRRDGFWVVDAEMPVGQGRIDLVLSGSRRPHALAMTLALEETDGSDLAMQLYNAQGELLAVDLFGNLVGSAQAGRTDTFIVPLSKYPTAMVVSLRRITGPVAVRGFVAFPVVTALDELPQGEREAFAALLGEALAAGRSTQGGGLTRIREVEDDEILERLLADPSYPDAAFRGALPAQAAFAADVSGTCYRFFTNLYLPLFSNPDEAERLSFVSSNMSIRAVMEGWTKVALSSYAPDEGVQAEFERKNGFKPLVIPVARDAVEVLVHPSNRFDSMDYGTLTRIFSEAVQQREGPLAWDPVSGLRGPILVAGGDPQWGTSRFFAEKVMGGEAFTSSMTHLDISFSHGVERFVAGNQNAISYAQHAKRNFPVKSLAIGPDQSSAVVADASSVAAGSYPLTRHLFFVLAYPGGDAVPEPVRKFADRLLSREGQRAVAATGSFALSASEVVASRQLLGL